MSNDVEVVKAKKEKRAALGRGLGSLLGGRHDEEFDKPAVKKPTETRPPAINKNVSDNITVSPTRPSEAAKPSVPPTARIWKIRTDKLQANENQPRKNFAAEALESLAASIRVKGIFQPIVARKHPKGHFEIIAGERRWRAAQAAGLQEVPVILKQTDDQDALELALIENIQREDLNPIEEAEAYKYLMDSYDMTQQQLSERVGKDRVTIANILRLLNLGPDVRTMVVAGEISLGQAKVLLKVTDDRLQRKIARKVANNKLTVRATEKLVEKALKPNSSSDISNLDVSDRLIKGLSEELQKLLGTKVAIDYAKGKGKISVHYYSDEELNQIVDRLRDKWQK